MSRHFIYLFHLQRKRVMVASRKVKAAVIIYNLILYYRLKMVIRERNFLHSNALLPTVTLSPWYILYNNGSDSDFINITTLTRAGFQNLLTEFNKNYIVKAKPGRPGRPPRVKDNHCVLAILLHFLGSQADSKTWQEMFGVAPATLDRLVWKGFNALKKSLDNLPEADIKWPSVQEQIILADKVAAKEPLIRGRWGFIDGKNYRVQEPNNSLKQNAMFNGWLHDVFVTGVACFTADGLVCWAKLNYFGSWNDGEMSRRFREKLADPNLNAPGHGVVSDTAFPVSDDMFGKILTPLKEGDIEKAPQRLRGVLTALANACTAIRQGAEWGMGAVEKPYRYLLKKCLMTKRKEVLY